MFAPFRDKSLTGFAEKGMVFIPAASSEAFQRGEGTLQIYTTDSFSYLSPPVFFLTKICCNVMNFHLLFIEFEKDKTVSITV